MGVPHWTPPTVYVSVGRHSGTDLIALHITVVPCVGNHDGTLTMSIPPDASAAGARLGFSSSTPVMADGSVRAIITRLVARRNRLAFEAAAVADHTDGLEHETALMVMRVREELETKKGGGSLAYRVLNGDITADTTAGERQQA